MAARPLFFGLCFVCFSFGGGGVGVGGKRGKRS